MLTNRLTHEFEKKAWSHLPAGAGLELGDRLTTALAEKSSPVAPLLISSPRRQELAGSSPTPQLASPTRASSAATPLLLASRSRKSKVLSHALTARGSYDGGLILIDEVLEGNMFEI
jgi:hypothetical protein